MGRPAHNFVGVTLGDGVSVHQQEDVIAGSVARRLQDPLVFVHLEEGGAMSVFCWRIIGWLLTYYSYGMVTNGLNAAQYEVCVAYLEPGSRSTAVREH